MSYSPVPVWSGLHRVAHWILAASVAALMPLGAFILASGALGVTDEGVDAIRGAHAATGAVFAIGLALRLAYLFTGPGSSRVGDILPSGKRSREVFSLTLKYYLSGFKGAPPLYFAHNPLAGVAYAAFFVFGLTQAVSGSYLYFTHVEVHAHAHNGAGHAEWAERLHLAGAAVIVFFVLAHLAALALHDIAERRGLASSMINGFKFFDPSEKEALEDEIREKSPRG